MPALGLEVFDKAVQKSNEWLKDLSETGGVGPDRQQAYHALRAVLWTVRDRLPIQEAFHLSAQLPLLIRGVFWEGYRPADAPDKMKSPDDFLAKVEERLSQIEGVEAEAAARAVFGVLERRIPEGEMAHVRQSMPKPLQAYLGQVRH